MWYIPATHKKSCGVIFFQQLNRAGTVPVRFSLVLFSTILLLVVMGKTRTRYLSLTEGDYFVTGRIYQRPFQGDKRKAENGVESNL